MNIRKKLEELISSKETELSESAFKELFGEDYRDRLIKNGFISNSFQMVFEEDGKLYILGILENDRDILGDKKEKPFTLSNWGGGPAFKEVDETTLETFDKKIENMKKQIALMEEVTKHKHYRIKSLFHKGK